LYVQQFEVFVVSDAIAHVSENVLQYYPRVIDFLKGAGPGFVDHPQLDTVDEHPDSIQEAKVANFEVPVLAISLPSNTWKKNVNGLSLAM
jgi:hypothetical protein